MKRINEILICFCALFMLTLNGCGDKDTDYSGMSIPEFSLILDEIKPDMNTSDNIPLVCVILSEAGLKSVQMFITKDGVENPYKEVTSFYDKMQYSVKELPLWEEGMTSFRLVATDLGNRTNEVSIPISVIKYMAPPVITFEKDEIIIDENTGSIDIPITKFEVKGATKLVSVEVKLFRKSTIEDIVLTPAFSQKETYSFEQEIIYEEGDNALQVKATDDYGKSKIETLPIKYISIPAPELAVSGSTTTDVIIANSGTSKTLTFNAKSSIGIMAINVYKVEKGVETELTSVSKTYNSEENVDFTAELPDFEPTWNAVKVVAYDRLGRSSSIEIPTIIDLNYKSNMRIGSQYYSKVADPAYPDAYCFFSVKDMKTYNLSEFYANISNIDMYFYFFTGNVRLYEAITNRPEGGWSEDVANNIPSFYTWPGRNTMKIKKFKPGVWSFNFDNVTSADLQTAAVQNYLNTPRVTEDFANYVGGEVAFFQTSASSTAPSKIGIMRIESFTVDPKDFTKGFYLMSFKILQ